MNRRGFVGGALLLAGSAAAQDLAAQDLAAPALQRPAGQRWNIAVPVLDFAAPNTGKPMGEAVQAALDAAFETGLPLVFPRGEWLIEKPLTLRHTARQRRGFPTILGAGVGDTVLRVVFMVFPPGDRHRAVRYVVSGGRMALAGRIGNGEICLPRAAGRGRRHCNGCSKRRTASLF